MGKIKFNHNKQHVQSKTKQREPSPSPRKRFRSKADIVKAIRLCLARITRAQLPEPEDGAPLTPIEALCARVLTKTASVIDWEFVWRGLLPFWTNRRMDQIEIVAEDLRGGEHGVVRLVEVCYKVLDHGYGSKAKEELGMGDLSAILKWTEAIQAVVEDLAEDENLASSQRLPSPKSRSRSLSPILTPVKKVASKSKGKGKKPGARTYTSSPEVGPEEDELDSQASDNDGVAELAQPSAGQARKKKAVVKAVAVKVASKQTKTKKRGTRKNLESSSEDGEAQENHRRSGRVPAATQTAVQAAKRRLVEGDTIYAPLHDGVYWPAIVMDVDDLDDGIKPKNDRQREDDYLVQLIPSRERWWIGVESFKKVPQKQHRVVPDGLNSRQAASFQSALDHLNDNLMLDRWLNGKDGDDTDTEEEEEEVVEAKRGAGKRGSDDGAEGEGNVKRARRSLS